MEKQTFSRASTQYQPRQFTYKQNIPEKNPSNELVNKMFLLISEGNFLKIKDFILNNKLSMTSRNESDESVIHSIIKNSNITIPDKLQLIQLAITNGSQVSAFDVNNITPLHLAVQLQNYDIVKLLLDNGATINVVDNQYKTPLHYAIIGENAECLIHEKEKKPIISINKNTKNNDVIANELYKELTFFLMNDVSSKQYIEQISNSIQNMSNMYPYEYNELIETNVKSVALILTDINKTEKDDVIFSTLSNLKKQTFDMLKKKLTKSTGVMPIIPYTNDGWGPGDLPYNKILKLKSITQIINNIDASIKSQKDSLMRQLNKTSASLESEVTNLSSVSRKLTQTLGTLTIYFIVIRNNINHNMLNENDMNIIQYLFTDDYNAEILLSDIDCPYKYKPLTDKIFDINNNVIFEINRDISCENDSNYRMTEADVMNLKKQHPNANIPKYPLSSDVPLSFGGHIQINNNDIYGSANNMIIRFSRNDDNDQNAHMTEAYNAFIDQDIPLNEDTGLYFDTKFTYYVFMLTGNLTEINTILQSITNNINNNNLYDIYSSIISHLVIKILNISLILGDIKHETEIIDSKLTGLNTFFASLSEKLLPQYKFLTEQTNMYIEKISKDMKKVATNYIQNIYNQLKELIENINNIFDTIEFYSAYKCIEFYYQHSDRNRFVFDDFYNAMNTDLFTNIIDKPMKRIKLLPVTLNDLEKLRTNDVFETKKILFQTYVPQITPINSISKIDNDNDLNPRLGFIYDSANIDDTLVAGINDDNVVNYVFTDFDGTLHIPTLDTYSTLPNNIDRSNVSLIGLVGTIHEKQYAKNDVLPFVIGKLLDDHMFILKYCIIRNLLQISYDVLMTNANNNLKNTLIKIRKDFSEFIKNPNDYGAILSLVGENINLIINNYINGLIARQSNILMSKILNNINLTDYYDRIKNVIPIETKSFSVDLNEIFDNFVSIYESKNDFNRSNIVRLPLADIVDDENETKNIVSISNYDYVIDSTNKICFNVNKDIVLLLIKHNADINACDNIGNSPLYYSIEMKNKEIIKLLISYNASSNRNKNKLGFTPLSYSLNEYARIMGEIVDNKYKVCSIITKRLIDELKKNEKYKNNIPKNVNIILPMTLYILNHQIYLIGKNYPHDWNYDNNKKLELILKKKEIDTIPLLNMDITDNIIQYYEQSNNYIHHYESNITKLTEEINMEQKKYDNIAKEIEDLKEKTDEYSISRQNVLDEMSKNIKNIIRNIQQKIDNEKRAVANIKTVKNDSYDSLKKHIQDNKKKLKFSNTAVDIYNSIFVDVINESDLNLKQNKWNFNVDTNTYQLLWKKYFSNENKNMENDYTQIIDLLIDYQKNIKNIDSHTNELKIISEYYKNVIIPFAYNYFELPNEYNSSNYPLTIVINIIVHVVKHTICTTLYNVIAKAITKYVLTIYPQTNMYATDNDYQNFVIDVIISIINGSSAAGDNSRLMKYIFGSLPLKMTKSVLKIYENEIESENIESLFLNINEILSLTISNDSSLLLKGLSDDIYPLFVDISKLFISEMKSLCDKYLASLQYQYSMLDIINVLLLKN